MPIKLLLIEDNPDHVLLTRKILEKSGGHFLLDSIGRAREGIQMILEGNYDLALCDYRLSELSALDILGEIRKNGFDLPFIVVTAAGSEKIAVELMKRGAYDYIVKDDSYSDILPMVIRNALDVHTAKKEKERLEIQIKELARFTYENPNPVMRISKEGVLVYANPASGFLIRDWDCQIGQLLPEQWRQLVMGALTSGVRKNIEMEHKGSFFSIIIVPVVEGGYLNLYALDITGRKKQEEELKTAYRQLRETQQELIQSSKMSAMGQLAAGVSHELNQPLTGIKGFAQVMLMEIEPASPLREDLVKIVEQADRMDKIIKNVRFFARKTEFKLEEIDINEPLKNSLELLKEQFKVRGIQINAFLYPALPKITVDQNQLQQVFLNLLTNARDAIESKMPREGGTVTVTTRLTPDQQNIEILVSDNGCGIPAQSLADIFTPFFTTKSPNGGMGLGLAIVYRIIENHGGQISVESKEGEGTGVTVVLPIKQAAKSK